MLRRRKGTATEVKREAPPAKTTKGKKENKCEEKTPNESPEQGETLTFQMVLPLKENSEKWVTEWSQFRKSNQKLLLGMTYIKDKLCLNETLGIEGSEEAVQMTEFWTQVLDDLQLLYQ